LAVAQAEALPFSHAHSSRTGGLAVYCYAQLAMAPRRSPSNVKDSGDEAVCLVLMRRGARAKALINHCLVPMFALLDLRMTISQIDPNDFGTDDAEIFRLVRDCEFMIVDASTPAPPFDYTFCK
jgi:hypothetical protein